MTKKVVLVTGGTGLVGNGIRIAHERDPRDDETFVFLSSKDADLTDKESTRKASLFLFLSSLQNTQTLVSNVTIGLHLVPSPFKNRYR